MNENTNANPGYAWTQLQRASEAARHHSDPAVRERARARVEAWSAVIEGMRSGTLSVGSRTPVEDTPAWVTLEVAHGGFATGRFLAESALRDHELARLAALPQGGPGETPRERLNLYYLSDAGQAELLEALRSGAYRVRVPEEGALPVVAWLIAEGHAGAALELIETLRPLMHRLRFYPERVATARPAGAAVRLQSAQEVAAQLEARRPQAQVVAMNATMAVWNPLYDRLVALWLDTVEGAAPDHARDASGRRVRGDDRQPVLTGGWPCRRWPGDWEERRERWLADYRARCADLSGKHADPKSGFAILRGALERCPSDSSALSGREVGRIRHALAGSIARHGAPGSAARNALRAEQRAHAARPLHSELARVLANRLRLFPQDAGIPSLDVVSHPTGADERAGVPADVAMPEHLLGRTTRALEAPVEELVELGVLGSGELLAQVLPQLTAQVAAAGIADGPLRELFAQIYAAFRARRSLLLLNLEHQVRLEELPWVAALGGVRTASTEGAEQARQTLEAVALLTLSAFPETVVPNPLVTELDALARRAELRLPLVREIAADIFMGTFTRAWSEAAALACERMRGTFYARYYDLPRAGEVREPETGRSWLASWFGPRRATAERLADQCRRRAVEAGALGGWVAKNGAVLEQSQILTTQNLAAMVFGLGLEARMRPLAPELAERAFGWSLDQLARPATDAWSELRTIKNAAYAWRQAIFFLSLCDAPTQRTLVAAVETMANAEQAPLARGLRLVLEGGRFDADGQSDGARRLLGWSCGRHWLAAADRRRGA